MGQADHVVALHLATGPHTEPAGDAGIQVDVHRRVGGVMPSGMGQRVGPLGHMMHRGGSPLRPRGQTLAHRRGVDGQPVGHVPQVARTIGARLAFGLVGQQQCQHLLPRLAGPLGAGALHHHAGGRLADAAGGEHALPLDLHHAGAAVAVGTVAGGVLEAQVRNGLAGTLGHLPEGLAGPGADLGAIQVQGKAFHYALVTHLSLLTPWRSGCGRQARRGSRVAG